MGSALLDSNLQNVVFLEVIRLQTSEDPDELQLLDECDSYWVEAWKTPAKQSDGACQTPKNNIKDSEITGKSPIF